MTASVVFCCTLLLASAVTADEKRPAGGFDVKGLYHENDFGVAGPYGRVHPDAPAEASQFDFLVGEFECDDRMLQPDGSWRESKASWVTRYILNGHGVKDDYRNDRFAGTSIRVWDAGGKVWRVAFFGMPGDYFGLEWKGQREGEDLVMRRHFENASGTPVESVLRFYDVTGDGFEWKNLNRPEGGEPYTTWEISCRRHEQ